MGGAGGEGRARSGASPPPGAKAKAVAKKRAEVAAAAAAGAAGKAVKKRRDKSGKRGGRRARGAASRSPSGRSSSPSASSSWSRHGGRRIRRPRRRRAGALSRSRSRSRSRRHRGRASPPGGGASDRRPAVERGKGGVKLFVGRLPRQVSQREIRECFEEFGEVLEVFVIDSQAVSNVGCAFVRMAKLDQARNAVEDLHEQRVLVPALRELGPMQVAFAKGEAVRVGLTEREEALPTFKEAQRKVAEHQERRKLFLAVQREQRHARKKMEAARAAPPPAPPSLEDLVSVVKEGQRKGGAAFRMRWRMFCDQGVGGTHDHDPSRHRPEALARFVAVLVAECGREPWLHSHLSRCPPGLHLAAGGAPGLPLRPPMPPFGPGALPPPPPFGPCAGPPMGGPPGPPPCFIGPPPPGGPLPPGVPFGGPPMPFGPCAFELRPPRVLAPGREGSPSRDLAGANWERGRKAPARSGGGSGEDHEVLDSDSEEEDEEPPAEARAGGQAAPVGAAPAAGAAETGGAESSDADDVDVDAAPVKKEEVDSSDEPVARADPYGPPPPAAGPPAAPAAGAPDAVGAPGGGGPVAAAAAGVGGAVVGADPALAALCAMRRMQDYTDVDGLSDASG